MMQINMQKNFYEKFKEIVNKPTTEFLLGNTVGLAGTGTAVWLINYLLTNKNYSQIKERIVNGVKLSIADQIWIRDNMILFLHDGFLCWHNTFMQLLACPEIRCKNYDSKNIMIMINYINSQFKKNYKGDCLSIRPIKVDMKFRRVNEADALDAKALANKDSGGRILITGDCDGKDYMKLGIYDDVFSPSGCLLTIDKNTIFKDNDIRNFISLNYEEYKNMYGIVNNKKYAENFALYLTQKPKNKKFSSQDINFFKEKNYFATFVMVRNTNYIPPHWYSYYVVYDKNKKIKFFLRADDLKTSWYVTSEDKFLKDLQNCNIQIVKYSAKNIVEKYYTPEMIYDAN